MRMRHPSPAARAIRNNPAPTTTTPMARATRSPAGARRSTVMAAPTTTIARRSMTPMTRRIAIRPAQQWMQWSPRRRPCRQAVPASAGSVRPRPGDVPAAGQVTCLPRRELERAGDQDDHTDRERHRARQRRLLHLDRRQRDAQRKGGHAEHGPDEEVPHAHEGGQPSRGASRRSRRRPGGSATAWGPGTAASSPPSSRSTCRGTTPRRRATSGPGIRIHAIDIVQPPGIGIPPIADMDAHQTIVTAALAAKSSAETPRKARWDARSGALSRDDVPRSAQRLSYSSWRRHQTPVSLRPLGARSSHWYMPQRPSSPRA